MLLTKPIELWEWSLRFIAAQKQECWHDDEADSCPVVHQDLVQNAGKLRENDGNRLPLIQKIMGGASAPCALCLTAT